MKLLNDIKIRVDDKHCNSNWKDYENRWVVGLHLGSFCWELQKFNSLIWTSLFFNRNQKAFVGNINLIGTIQKHNAHLTFAESPAQCSCSTTFFSFCTAW